MKMLPTKAADVWASPPPSNHGSPSSMTRNSFDCYGVYRGNIERGSRGLGKSNSDFNAASPFQQSSEADYSSSTHSSHQHTFGGPTPSSSYHRPTYHTQSSHQLTFEGGDDALFGPSPVSLRPTPSSSYHARPPFQTQSSHQLTFEGGDDAVFSQAPDYQTQQTRSAQQSHPPFRARSYSISGSPSAPTGIRARGATQESAPPVVVVPRAPPTPRSVRPRRQPMSLMRRLTLLLLSAAAVVAALGMAQHFGAGLGSFSRLASDDSGGAGVASAEERLMEWARSEGAQLRVTVGYNADGVRGLFTTEDILQDEVMIDIPDHIIFSFRNAPAAETAPHLLKEVHASKSRLEPYLDVLPKSDEVLTGYNWPEEYIPYLASDALEQQVQRTFKRYAQDVWSGQLNENMDMTLREAVGSGGVSLEDFQHAVSVITSRTMQTRAGSLSLVPIADLANHHPSAEGHVIGSATRNRNFQFVAGRDFKRGEEVLVTYGNLRNDDLLLYYGFVDETTQPPALCSCDHRDFVLFQTQSESLGPDDWSGTREEMDDELDRLKSVLHVFQRRLQELGPLPQTAPRVTSVLAAFHRLRKEALLHEIRRLSYLLAGTEQ